MHWMKYRTGDVPMKFRTANKNDLYAIVSLLADDVLGSKREELNKPLPDFYITAFEEIMVQHGNQIIVAEEDYQIIGCLQLTLIPSLSRKGTKRAQIESVRVHKNYRGKNIGEKLFEEAISIAKEEKCGLVQLTTDKQRNDAHRFYDKLGFEASHDGMKLIL